MQTHANDYSFQVSLQMHFHILTKKADEVKRTESQFVWQLLPFSI